MSGARSEQSSAKQPHRINQADSADRELVEADRAGRRRRIWIAASIVAFVVALAIAWIAGHALAKDRVPARASVRGVDIGGMTSGEAIQHLQAAFDAKAARDVLIMDVARELGVIKPSHDGLRIDYVQTVRDAGARDSWNPLHIIKVLAGGGPSELVVDTDRETLASAIQSIAADVQRSPVDAKVDLNPDGTISRSAMQFGEKLVVATTLESVRGHYSRALSNDDPQVRAEGDLHRVSPQVTDQQAEVFITQTLEPALAPIEIQAGPQTAQLGADVLAKGMSVRNESGELRIDVDLERVLQAAEDKLDDLSVTKPTNAKVTMRDGRPTITPSVDGQGVSSDGLRAVLKAALLENGPRQAAVDVAAKPAKFTTADAERLQIREVIGEFTTYFPPSEYRNVNLGLAAKGINDTLIRPGETFSLAQATGPRNAATGYVPGGVLVGDHIENVVGGGVSQSATTTYNAAFFAGMTDVEHHPHTQYFSQYPPGREATVYEGVLDLKFRNDTPYGVLMEAFINPSMPGNGSMTVRVWSTRYYDEVRASEPQISNYTSAPARTSNRPGCIPQGASRGFDVKYQRFLTREGQTQVEDYFWRYDPVPAIVCTA